MAYAENQLQSATGLGSGATRAQTDLEKANAAISEAIALCEAIVSLEIKLIGYQNEAKGEEELQPPMPEAALPRLGACADDLMRAARRAGASLSRINGAL